MPPPPPGVGLLQVKDVALVVDDILDLSNACIEVSQGIKAKEEAIGTNRKDTGRLVEVKCCLSLLMRALCIERVGPL